MHDDSHKPTDAEIVRRVVEGDVNAFESLLTRHKDLVLKIIRKHMPHQEVEETAQDVFIRVYQSLPTFKAESNFRQWISSIAVRTCYDFWRKQYRSRELPIGLLTEEHQKWLENVMSDQSGHLLEDKDSQKKAEELLNRALDRLSPEERMVLELVYLEGLSGREAADLLGWSVPNVKVRLFRARRKLRKLVAG